MVSCSKEGELNIDKLQRFVFGALPFNVMFALQGKVFIGKNGVD